MTMVTLRDAVDKRFVDLVRSGRVKVPPYPAAARQLQALLASPDWGLPEVARVVATDQALAAAVLRRANSADMGGRPATSVQAAVARLGSKAITSLALTVGLGAEASRPGTLRGLRRLVWRQALLNAELCAMLAVQRGVNAEEAFTCGLLHDFGKVVALGCIETIAGEGIALSPARCLELIEAYHVELGVVIVAQWQLPDPVARVIVEHHEPGTRPNPLTQLVVIGDHVVELLDLAPSVSRDDLARVPFLTEARDLAHVAQCLLALPATVAAYEAGDASESWGRPPRVTPESTSTLREPPQAVSLPARSQAIDLRVGYMAGDGLGARARVPMREQAVVPFSIDTAKGPVEFFATVTRCEAEGPSFLIEARPLALTPLAQERWSELLSTAPAQAPARAG
jgi:putative nucleotidyltransferase with HDIG domain